MKYLFYYFIALYIILTALSGRRKYILDYYQSKNGDSHQYLATLS